MVFKRSLVDTADFEANALSLKAIPHVLISELKNSIIRTPAYLIYSFNKPSHQGIFKFESKVFSTLRNVELL